MDTKKVYTACGQKKYSPDFNTAEEARAWGKKYKGFYCISEREVKVMEQSDGRPEGGHTPTPWKVYRCHFVDEIGKPNQNACGLNGQSFDMSHDECHHPLSLADAQFIVRAVNVHEELLDIAFKVLKMLPPTDEYRKRVERAIAKAKGE